MATTVEWMNEWMNDDDDGDDDDDCGDGIAIVSFSTVRIYKPKISLVINIYPSI